MFAYLFIGLVGAPVFAQFKGGIGSIFSPTFGFIISFIFVSFLVGICIERWGNNRRTYLFTGVLVILVNYVIGTNYMFAALQWWADAPEGFRCLVFDGSIFAIRYSSMCFCLHIVKAATLCITTSACNEINFKGDRFIE
ncbi:biotin transporter BioY [Pseudogracilibacillus auburnensis]|uniref:biotin transporter BioY n=1 Tax=Pseudogracilibacillus auburnensis TaxID=1494959 RepID=UPI001A95884C|nr:biotin transporter BioY [Pseudogracilibacillus auburnensis]MBO1001646.1 biotin transporter BioY [Pseudogracilibacillus auburnensis]